MTDGPAIGKSVGHYRILSKIGEGGMGEVYLARDGRLDRNVALKALSREFSSDQEWLERFISEARATSALNHPNIITIFEVLEDDGERFIVSEFIDGRTLKELMKDEPPTMSSALEIAIQIASALDAAHKLGIVHRDIKPANIMVRQDGIVKVVDFGIAKISANFSSEQTDPEMPTIPMGRTQPGMMVGTPKYMSPEQARGHAVDTRSDIFSFGIVMYELFSGKRPFSGEEAVDLISSIIKDEPPSMASFIDGLPKQLDRIVEKALRKERKQRYQNVRDLQLDLEDLRDELKHEARANRLSDSTAPQAIHSTATGSNSSTSTLQASIVETRRFTLLHALLFAAGLVLIGGLAWYFGIFAGTDRLTPDSFVSSEVANWASAPGELFSSAKFSPDGKMIAFSSTRSGSKDIWVTQSGSIDAIQVTNDEFSDRDPVWSPKGDEVAYFSERPIAPGQAISFGIWRSPALGGTPRSVAVLPDRGAEIRAWGPSGKIYFQSKGDLLALDLGSNGIENVTNFAGDGVKVTFVDISADETEIAYVVERENKWSIFRNVIGGDREEAVFEADTRVESFHLSDGGEKIYFSSVDNGANQIFVIDRKASKPQRLTASESDNVVLDVSSDGRSMLYGSVREESSIWKVSLLDGKETALVRGLDVSFWPDVSGDDSALVFQTARNMNRGDRLYRTTIKSIELNGPRAEPNAVVVAESGALPKWSPDGSTIAFIRINGQTRELRTANRNGGSERVLAAEGVSVPGYSVSPYNPIQNYSFDWSRDGKEIVYLSDRSGASNLWTVGQMGTDERKATENSDPKVSYYSPIWNSAGTAIAFSGQDQTISEKGEKTTSLFVLDRSTQRQEKVYSTVASLRLIGWSASEDALIAVETDSRSGLAKEVRLIEIPLTTG
ncbi:MAG TPA: protein kinase, partial [Pyrinomonadaceae bacterium]|nr:protein kinase [Pyrinomonadaceae bacterium]